MKVTLLAENSVCKTDLSDAKEENGLSLFVEFGERKILFDTGQSDLFIHNARKMGIDLSLVDYRIISNVYFNHGTGLNHFQKINKKARVFLHINAAKEHYTGILGFIPYYLGLDQKTIARKSRIYFIDQDTQIEDDIILLDGFPKPESDKTLLEKDENRFITDKLNNELVMLLIENEEIVLFSGYSHSGIINIIDEVRLFSKNMRIKATFGCFHINDLNEYNDYITDSTGLPGETESGYYPGYYSG